MMNEMDVKKELYKSKVNAKFSHYVSGKLYYKVQLEEGVFQFPIATVDKVFGSSDFMLSEDLGITYFNNEMKGSELGRWIAKAIKSGDFIKVG